MATATTETSGIDGEIEWYGVTLSFPCKGYGHFNFPSESIPLLQLTMALLVSGGFTIVAIGSKLRDLYQRAQMTDN